MCALVQASYVYLQQTWCTLYMYMYEHMDFIVLNSSFSHTHHITVSECYIWSSETGYTYLKFADQESMCWLLQWKRQDATILSVRYFQQQLGSECVGRSVLCGLSGEFESHTHPPTLTHTHTHTHTHTINSYSTFLGLMPSWWCWRGRVIVVEISFVVALYSYMYVL